MSFNIEVVKVDVESKGKYRVAKVAHKTSDGKIDSKPLFSFGAGKAAFDVLSQAQQGDVFDIESKKIKNEKDGKEYWTWVVATPAGKAGISSVSKTTPAAVRSSYETPGERAARQVYIVRQSSIANAVALLGTQAALEDVIKTAKAFEAYVFATEGYSPNELVLPSEVS